MHIQHYENVDVLPENTIAWMPYFTNQIYMFAHHYERVDVLSDCSYYRMPYYTDHKYKGAHQYVCVSMSYQMALVTEYLITHFAPIWTPTTMYL